MRGRRKTDYATRGLPKEAKAAIDFYNKIKSSENFRYSEEKHIPLIYTTIIERGEGPAAFCKEAGVCLNTFYRWLRLYPLFHTAYKVALAAGLTDWEKLPLQKEIDYKYWNHIADARYKAKAKNIGVSDAAPETVLNALLKAWDDGELSSEDLTRLSNFFLNKISIMESLNIDKTNEELNVDRKELLKHIISAIDGKKRINNVNSE